MVQNVVTFVAIAIQTQTMDMIGKGKMVFLKSNNDDLHKHISLFCLFLSFLQYFYKHCMNWKQ